MTESGGTVKVDELARWLTEQGLAEERRGYGHATGDEIARALLEAFDVSWSHTGGAEDS